MVSKRTIGIVLIVVGLVVLVLALGADLIGIGQNPNFGQYQLLGAVVGAIVAVVGVPLALRRG